MEIIKRWFFILLTSYFLISCRNIKSKNLILCDCETLSDKGFIATSECKRFSQIFFTNIECITNSFAHSGRNAIKLTKEHRFGMGYDIFKVQPGEYFRIKIWRHRSNKNGVLIVSADDYPNFNIAQRNSNGIIEGEWEQLSLDLIIPGFAKIFDLKIFAANPDSILPAYFDDLSIEYVTNKFTRPQTEQSDLIDSRDGVKYKTVKIGNQWWMADNLKYKTISGSFCFGNSEQNVEHLGRFYTWYAAINAVPVGWKIPSDDDWKKMEKYLGMSDESVNQYGNRGTDITILLREFGRSGFDAELAGIGSDSTIPIFYNLHNTTCFWTSTEIDSANSWCREIGVWTDLGRFKDLKNMKFSVRCIKE